ncbi:MAG: divalent-cation tolerance protein CutA [Gammaproteobacteria bacterium]|nr:divalent-cation tolerance protein CutA [Gammaproteobacteria bacterium]
MNQQSYQLFISTAPDQATAESLARQLVAAKLAACVNLMPNVSSIYEWQGKIEQENEVVMLIKSKAKHFTEIEKFLVHKHPYDVPELISCNIDQVSASYGQWLTSALKK